jgi:hypothetical protein
MTTDPGSFVPVNLNVLRQTLVEAVHEQVQERREAGKPERVPPALESGEQRLVGDNDPALDHDLRLQGYLARVAEVDMFEPARRFADWVIAMVEERTAQTGDQQAAIAALCGDLARAEPVEKPDVEDPDAMSWRVPGPGGHVRHYVARRAIEHSLRDRSEPVVGDPAALKQAWMYGFFVRTCEEALEDDDDAAPQPDAG